MPSSSKLSSRLRRRLLAGGAASAGLVLVGCGSGGGFDALVGVGSGGTGSFTSGPIRGFGSIVVGTVRYEDGSATILNDAGRAIGRADLRLGMIVDVTGSAISIDAVGGQRRATASSIGLRSVIEGPVESIDAASATLIVLGQTVRVTATTVFDDALRGGLGALRPGGTVEIYGLMDEQGRCVATRIEREDSIDRYKLRGVVSALDSGARTMRIGALVISYAELPSVPDDLADGQYVRVELDSRAGAGGVWRATRLQSNVTAMNLPAAQQLEAELEGFVTTMTSSTRFEVDGVMVDTSMLAYLPPGLAPGRRVEVQGVLQGGLLIAGEVELEDDDGSDDDGSDFEIEGTVSSVNRGAQTLVIHGVTVDYATARFVGGTPGQLAVGVELEVEGRLAPDGNTLVASEIGFDE
ncbi:MAG: hypothetical protein AMXMBFR52_17100 [Burkholderiales bacterium]|jgi:hypothetical protein